MLVQLNYLKNHKAVDAGPLLSALCQVVDDAAIDPGRLAVPLDWVQYRKNFRPPLDPRRYLLSDGSADSAFELAIDVRRLKDDDLAPALQSAIACLYGAAPHHDAPLYLEDYTRPSQSVTWAFNRTFWQYLSAWESTFQKGFLSALPGGVSDGTNPEFWRDRLTAFLDNLDDLNGRGLVPEEIYVLELGVGGGQQARVWLDTFRDLCAERGRDYLRRVRYLMSDYSHDVLRAARNNVREYDEQVSCLNVDAADPLQALAFLRYKVLFVHSCNLYDNLPTDEIARRDGRLYEVQVRAYLPAAAVEAVCDAYSLERAELPSTIQRFLRIGPEYFDDVETGVHFWADVWDALRLEQRYVLLEEPETYRVAPGAHGARLGDLLDDYPGDIRLHLPTAAMQSFVNTLPLLHPRGMFQVQDLFVTDLDQYRGTFRGPGKMDGSIVNWLNGPLFRLVGAHLGYTVHLEPFARYRAKSNTVILTTSQRD
ncbi:MAG TPA: hypothetical protein VII06_40320 [Chloroflexota bacterium]|jgi:hypothetical protein